MAKPDRSLRHNLTVELTSFVGRECETAEIVGLLSTTRAVTLTGAGGIGKTRLALRVARQLLCQFPDGVWFIGLASVSDPALVPNAVAAALGISERRGRPVSRALADALKSKHTLLIFDNCEHVVGAAADLVEQILHNSPTVSILATSREGLRISGETIWPVPPLSHPDGPVSASQGLTAQFDAVRLFADRACAVVPGFTLSEANAKAVSDICSRLEGIPLAIELAAARLHALSAPQLADRLEDCLQILSEGSRTAPQRQQTLKATIEWSYNLLEDAEKEVFHRLSVFAHGCTLEAAEAVCSGCWSEPNEIVDLLAHLVAKSLVLADATPGTGVRYRLLEPLRQYAAKRLRASGDGESARQRHALYYVRLAEGLENPTAAPKNAVLLDDMEREQDNLRAALRWLMDSGDRRNSEHLGSLLGRFWLFNGHLDEGRSWFDALLEFSDPVARPRERAELLCRAGGLALAQGNISAALRHLHASRDLLRSLGANDRVLGQMLVHLSTVARLLGNVSESRALLDEAQEIAERASDPFLTSTILLGLANLAYLQEDFEGSRTFAEAAFNRASAIGLVFISGLALELLGAIKYDLREYDAAKAYLEQCLAQQGDRSSRRSAAEALVLLGQIATDEGDFAHAFDRLSESIVLFQDLGNRLGLATALEGCARLAMADADPKRCVRLIGAASALRESLGTGRVPVLEGEIRNRLAIACQILGQQASASALESGRLMTTGQAVAYALSRGYCSEAPASPKDAGGDAGRNFLTAREQEVARLVARGLSNRQIAGQLGISERTAANHVFSILGKFGFHSRAQFAANAPSINIA